MHSLVQITKKLFYSINRTNIFIQLFIRFIEDWNKQEYSVQMKSLVIKHIIIPIFTHAFDNNQHEKLILGEINDNVGDIVALMIERFYFYLNKLFKHYKCLKLFFKKNLKGVLVWKLIITLKKAKKLKNLWIFRKYYYIY